MRFPFLAELFRFIRMFPKEVLWRIMVAATVLVVAFADMGREVNLSRLIDITGETSLAPAFGTRYLAAPMIFFKMKSVVVHDNF